MKYRVMMIAATAALAAPGVAANGMDEQDVDPARVAELRCQLVGICGETVTSDDGGIDNEETRGGSFRDLKNKATSTSTAPSTTPRREVRRATERRAPVPSTVGQRRTRTTVEKAVDVSEEIKGSADLFVTFARNSDRLVPSARQDIKELAQVLSMPNAEGGELRLMIAGHTDATGDEEFNKELSTKRAEAVRQALIAEGVRPSQLEAVGYGEEQLKDSNKPNDGINRRVEAVVID